MWATTLADRMVADLPALLRPGDVLVANDTRVIPAQLEGRRGAARIGLTLDQPRADGTWHALARNARRLRPATVLTFDATATLGARSCATMPTAAWHCASTATARVRRPVARAGALALPPYIARPHGPTADDAADYQTVFAASDGAVAAPTAGLHFTPRAAGSARRAPASRASPSPCMSAPAPSCRSAPTTWRAHRMHAERGEITADAADAINAARGGSSRSAPPRCACSRARPTTDGRVQPFDGDTACSSRPATASAGSARC